MASWRTSPPRSSWYRRLAAASTGGKTLAAASLLLFRLPPRRSGVMAALFFVRRRFASPRRRGPCHLNFACYSSDAHFFYVSAAARFTGHAHSLIDKWMTVRQSANANAADVETRELKARARPVMSSAFFSPALETHPKSSYGKALSSRSVRDNSTP